MPDRDCSRCLYSVLNNPLRPSEGTGCRRMPPTGAIMQVDARGNHGAVAIFPPTVRGMWCFEFKDRTTASEPTSIDLSELRPLPKLAGETEQ